jgi:ABC-type uncharacterized transport system permease subunit
MLNTITSILSTTILYATPLLLTGLGGLYSERSGVINIGLEGMMTIGAFTAAQMTIVTGNAWLGLLFAVIAGILLALIHAIATISFQADQTVSGVAINFLAAGLSVYLVKRYYEGAGQTPVVPTKLEPLYISGLSDIPVIGPTLFQAYPTTYIALIAIFLTSWLLYRTTFGLRLRAIGENPHAAATAGIHVIQRRYVAVLISGALAAIGGAGLSIAIGSEFSHVTVAGQGYIALAALIFGKWRPIGLLGAALFFGFATSLALVGQIFGLTAYFPSEVLSMIPYFFTILALAGFVGRSESPAALGKPYQKGTR